MQAIKIFKLVIAGFALLALTSCEKPAGPGGRAVVKGRVFAHDWDNQQRWEISKGYAPGERVYIIYGEQNSVGDDVRTSYDGTFEFRYLTKGHYKIFVNSLDTSSNLKGNDTWIPVIREFDITSDKQELTLPDIIINI